MAVKITRQPNQIVLIGAPTSAGAHGPGTERAPQTLRAAGLAARLAALGYDVSDAGDCTPQSFAQDDDNPRMRNVRAILVALSDLRLRVEQVVKSGALPLILGGDCTIALATLAGVRRYYNKLALFYFDRDADMNIPASTPSGRVHGMGLAHITGRGAPELVRFWIDPPLVREPDVALFGIDRLDPPEEAHLASSPVQTYPADEIRKRGAAEMARVARNRLQTSDKQLVIHFDVDAIADSDFGFVDVPGAGGLPLSEVRAALGLLTCAQNLAAIEVTEYNPERDADGSGAKIIVELLADVLAVRRTSAAWKETAVGQAGHEGTPGDTNGQEEAKGEPIPVPDFAPGEDAGNEKQATEPNGEVAAKASASVGATQINECPGEPEESAKSLSDGIASLPGEPGDEPQNP